MTQKVLRISFVNIDTWANNSYLLQLESKSPKSNRKGASDLLSLFNSIRGWQNIIHIGFADQFIS